MKTLYKTLISATAMTLALFLLAGVVNASGVNYLDELNSGLSHSE